MRTIAYLRLGCAIIGLTSAACLGTCGKGDDAISKDKAPAPEDCASPPADAATDPLGFRYIVLKPGQGDYTPRKNDIASVRAQAWSASGESFLSYPEFSLPPSSRDQPGLLGVAGRVVAQMKVGERRRIWGTTEQLQSQDPKWPTGAMCAEFELLVVNKDDLANKAPPLPPALAEKPPHTLKAAEGVEFGYVHHGEGRRRPKDKEIVTVTVSAWYLGGHLANKPYVQGQRVRRPVTGFPPGAAALLRKMVVGDHVRAWVEPGQGVIPARGPTEVPMVAELRLDNIE